VNHYFQYIRELRNGQQEAVKKLIDLWDEDGMFEFAGAEPVSGTYKGRNAIHVLYKNRVNACGMPLRLEGKASTSDSTSARDVALGVVDTHVNRVRTLGGKGKGDSTSQRVAAGWTTIVGTEDKRGFQVSGNHTFTFKDGKISALKIVVAPKADKSDGLSLEGLAVNDIGRLSLAAWAVV
jgi:ketosteroid isomerase-like protein